MFATLKFLDFFLNREISVAKISCNKVIYVQTLVFMIIIGWQNYRTLIGWDRGDSILFEGHFCEVDTEARTAEYTRGLEATKVKRSDNSLRVSRPF